MMLFQVIILIILAATVLFFVVLRRSALRDKMYLLVFVAMIAFLILVPQATQVLANFLGIGRGVDLVLYVSNLFFLYLLFLYSVRMKKIERDLTVIVRELALRNNNHKK